MAEDGQTSTSPFIGVREVAERYRMSTRTIYDLMRSGGIPHRRLPGVSRCLFLPHELEEWEAGSELEVIEGPRGGRVVRPVGTRPVRAPSTRPMAATIEAA